MKKRIFFLIPDMHGGGAQKVVSQIIHFLDRNKFSIHLVLLQKEGPFLETLDNDVKIICLNKTRVRKSLFPLISLIMKEKPDIVFTSLGHLNLMLSPFIPFFPKSIKLIARETNIVSIMNEGKRFRNWLYRTFYKNYNCIIAQSLDMKEDLMQNYGLPEEIIYRISNPVDIPLISKRAEEKTDFDFSSDFKVLLAAGRLKYQKGFDMLIRSFSSLPENEYRLIILGEGEDKEILEHLIKENNLSERVILKKFEKNPFPYMKMADVFVLSSRNEGFPNVVLEALACGTPVLANNCPGGINEIIIPGVNGEICQLEDSDNFRRMLYKALELKDSDTIKSTIEKYSDYKILKEYEQLLLNF